MNNYFSVVKEYLTIKKTIILLKIKIIKKRFFTLFKKKMSNKKRISATKKSSKFKLELISRKIK